MIIPADHPALAGTFSRRARSFPAWCFSSASCEWPARGRASLPSVKFHAPLRPGEEFVIRHRTSQKFTVRRGETLIASGSFALRMSAVWLEQRERGSLLVMKGGVRLLLGVGHAVRAAAALSDLRLLPRLLAARARLRRATISGACSAGRRGCSTSRATT